MVRALGFAALCLLMCFLLPGASFADTVSYACSPDMTGTFSNQSGSLTNDTSCQQFDTSLGTLTAVDITLNWTLHDSTGVSNFQSSTSVVASVDWTVGVSGAGGEFGAGTLFDMTSNCTKSLAAFDPGEICAVTSTGSTTLSPLSFGNWEGTGNFMFSLNLGSPLISANVPYSTTSGDATIASTVKYEYTPAAPPTVPEPATFTMFGLGLATLAGLSRRRPR